MEDKASSGPQGSSQAMRKAKQLVIKDKTQTYGTLSWVESLSHPVFLFKDETEDQRKGFARGHPS